MTKLTTHVLDIYSGKPGKGIKVDLFYINDNEKIKLNSIVLNSYGRSDGPLIEKDNYEEWEKQTKKSVAYHLANKINDLLINYNKRGVNA